MRATDLLRSRVVDAAGTDCGPVRDVRITRASDGRFQITGLVLGGGRFARAAHSLGVCDGRIQGPWLLRRLTRDAERQARFVAADQVRRWGPGQVTLHVPADALTHFRGDREGQ